MEVKVEKELKKKPSTENGQEKSGETFCNSSYQI